MADVKKAVPKAAEPSKVEKRCPGCNRRTQGSHCVYPSNPVFNALNPVKRDVLSTLPIVVERRSNASKIKATNRHNAMGSGMNGGNQKWWEGPPSTFKPIAAAPANMASTRFQSKLGR